MSKEGQPRPFSDTQKAYLNAAQKIVGDILAHPHNTLSQKLKYEEAKIGECEPIMVRVKGRKMPISLPIDYSFRKYKRRNNHNVAQLYLFGDQTPEEIEELTGAFSAVLSTQSATRAILERAPQDELEYASLNFVKPSSEESIRAADERLVRRILEKIQETVSQTTYAFLGPTPEIMPTARNRSEYAPISTLLGKSYVGLTRVATWPEIIGNEPPITVVPRDGKFFVKSSDSELLHAFIDKRMREMRIHFPDRL